MTTNLMSCTACGMESEACEKCPVCGTEASVTFDRAEADRLTKRYTALDTFAELVAVMGTPDRQTYAPSIYPNNVYKGRKIPGEVRLAAIVRAAGFKVFDGSRVA